VKNSFLPLVLTCNQTLIDCLFYFTSFHQNSEFRNQLTATPPHTPPTPHVKHTHTHTHIKISTHLQNDLLEKCKITFKTLIELSTHQTDVMVLFGTDQQDNQTA
jgi:hypothetical protein